MYLEKLIPVTEFIAQIPVYQLAILSLLLILFVVQISYWMNYSRIAKFRNRHRTVSGDPLPAVSIVVIVTHNDEDYIENGLPLLLEQEHSDFEVIVVNDCGGRDIDFALSRLTKAYSNLKFTTLKKDDKFNHSRKIPIIIGLKAAKNQNVVITDTDALPTNEKWLAYVCRGFCGADMVIGYTGFEIKEGLANRVIRCSRLSSSIRSLSAAIAGKPYRGIYNNIGFTKKLFFDSRGYTHLRMTVGEDDLFVQKVAPYCYTSVIINPQSTLRQNQYGGLGWWWAGQRYSTYAMRYYPTKVRIKTFIELLTRALFFTTIGALILLVSICEVTNPVIWATAALLLILRELVLYLSIHKIANRLGEINIVWSFMLYDLICPTIEAILCISRRIKPPKTLWIQNSK